MQTKDMSCFDSERLHMRALDDGDEALYCSLYTDPATMRNVAAPLSPEGARRSFRAACREQAPYPQRWIIHDRASGNGIGLLGLVRQGGRADVGVMLLGGWERRGFATESMAALVDQVFSSGLLPRLHAYQSVADNPPVTRLMLKLGFMPLPQSRATPGVREWVLHQDEWLAGKKPGVTAHDRTG